MSMERESIAWDAEVDVAVVGFGGAGACAALEAAQHGAEVMVIDRFHGGGSTAVSGAVVYAGGGTPYQEAVGYDDTPEEMYRYLEQEVGDAVSQELLRQFCEQSRDDLRWLEELGVPFEASLCPFKTSYPTDDYYLYFSGNEQAAPFKSHAKPAPRGHRARGKGTSGKVLFGALEKAAQDRGIQVRTQTQVQGLITSEDGRVAGLEGRTILQGSFWATVHGRLSRINAKAVTYAPPAAKRITAILAKIMERRSRPYRLRVRKGVVLAAGGFIHNQEMVKQLAPDYQKCMPLGTIGDDGTGIRLGEGVGGATARMARASAWRFFVPPEALMQGVLVNNQGKRICNEALYGAAVGKHIVAQGGDAYLIFDDNTRKEAMGQLRTQAAYFQLMSMLPTLLFGREKAPSIEALAEKIGLPAGELQATLSEYNTVAAQGDADPLGKTEERFCPQVTPPFYAIDCSIDASGGVPCVAMTLGGLVVDESTGEVKRDDGSVIQGLYAAGRNAVGICSESYVSGLSISDCVFSGRRAGRHAAGVSMEQAPPSLLPV